MRLIIILLLLCPMLTFGQKIKVKKGTILFDKEEVAKMESTKPNEYKVSSLSGEHAFNVNYKFLAVSAAETVRWLELISKDGKKTEIAYEELQFTLNPAVMITRLLYEKYGLLDKNGINNDKVTAFFQEERESLSKQYLEAAAAAKLAYEERKKLITQHKPYVQGNGSVVFGGMTSSNVVGKVIKGNTYSLRDLDNVEVATATHKAGSKILNVVTYTDEKFAFSYSGFGNITAEAPFERSVAQQFVEEMVGRGYPLGHFAKEHGRKMRAAKLKIAKDQSDNIYGTAGYIYDKDGVRYDGKVFITFETIDANLDGVKDFPSWEETNSADNLGKRVGIKYINEKGKERTKIVAAKHQIKFAVKEDGKEEVYYGMKTKGDALRKFNNATNLAFDNSYFYHLIYENKGIQLLDKPGKEEEGVYVIKLPNQKVGFMIDYRNNEKLSKALAEYLASCKSLSADIQNGGFDLSKESELKRIVDEYVAECKKG